MYHILLLVTLMVLAYAFFTKKAFKNFGRNKDGSAGAEMETGQGGPANAKS